MTTLESSAPITLPDEPGVPAAPLGPQPWKWTGDDLVRMGEANLLPPEGRFELLNGVIYRLMPPGPLHSIVVDIVRRLLEEAEWGRRTYVRQQNPFRLTEHFDPQPDVAVVRGTETDYRSRFPGPEDALLLVEVSDSSLEYDREMKLPAYADAAIRECWIVNLPERQIEVYTEPVEGVYRTRRLYRSGEAISPLAVPGLELSVSELLGEEAAAG